MRKGVYSAITNAGLVVGAASALLYSHAGQWRWLLIAVAAAVTLAVTVAYFVNVWATPSRTKEGFATDGSEKGIDQAAAQASLVRSATTSQKGEFREAMDFLAAHEPDLLYSSWTYDRPDLARFLETCALYKKTPRVGTEPLLVHTLVQRSLRVSSRDFARTVAEVVRALSSAPGEERFTFRFTRDGAFEIESVARYGTATVSLQKINRGAAPASYRVH